MWHSVRSYFQRCLVQLRNEILQESPQVPVLVQVVFGNACVGYWNATYSFSINYSGSWNATYVGYHTNLNNVSGTFSGPGSYSQSLTLNAFGGAVPTLCISVRKLDASNLTLTLFFMNSPVNSTSSGYGSVRGCAAEEL